MPKGSCLQLAFVLLLWFAQVAQADQFVFSGEVSLGNSAETFGGFSGLELSSDGSAFTALSDRGHYIEGQITRRDGQLTKVTHSDPKPILKIDGDPVTAANFDAEGLAQSTDGTFYMSFEGFHRVRRYARLDKPAQNIPNHPDFGGLQTNSSLELLAIDAAGRLYTAPERSGKLERPFPLYRFEGGAWKRFGDIPRLGEYLLVGADIGPDGQFYLLERGFRGISFSSRIRRFPIERNGLGAGEVLLVTDYGRHDNLEGLSIWQDEAGTTIATMIADDNFRFFQSTELVEYKLVPAE
ncbi:MAG: esterase-like activity of phytase family protein [Pseudomonadota bacterium]